MFKINFVDIISLYGVKMFMTINISNLVVLHYLWKIKFTKLVGFA